MITNILKSKLFWIIILLMIPVCIFLTNRIKHYVLHLRREQCRQALKQHAQHAKIYASEHDFKNIPMDGNFPSIWETNTNNQSSIYSFKVDNIDGKAISLSEFKGSVLLIVNVASKCGFTKQYEGLQKLYEKYNDQGFLVLGFPANNFGNQEPGTDTEIKTFCTTKFEVTFPMFSKISVKGKDIHPLYQYLTSPDKTGEFGKSITWNFNKFLISKDGKTLARFSSKQKPLDPQIILAVETALAQ